MNKEKLHHAYVGSLIADAMAMPVHWYYDVSEMDRAYGDFDDYQDPIHPHTGSIFYRSHYQPLNEKGDILGSQAEFWGQKGVHYHRGLTAGDNTVNYYLARELYALVVSNGEYTSEAWLERYIEIMLNPDSHGDTYLEEYHRGFFTNYAKGLAPEKCGIADIHIGGLAQVPALIAALAQTGCDDPATIEQIVQTHVSHTHRSQQAIDCATSLTRLLISLSADQSDLAEAMANHANSYVGTKKLDKWKNLEDRSVIGRKVSPACYLPESFVAALYLIWKYQNDFSNGILANAKVGGDSCHRGAVVGSVLGSICEIPERWVEGLSAPILIQP